ncbi:MAG: hypothetical protein ACK559_31035, partial [bacterium]
LLVGRFDVVVPLGEGPGARLNQQCREPAEDHACHDLETAFGLRASGRIGGAARQCSRAALARPIPQRLGLRRLELKNSGTVRRCHRPWRCSA